MTQYLKAALQLAQARRTDLVVPIDRSCDASCPNRVGNAPRKSYQHAGEQARLDEKTSARLRLLFLHLFQ